MAPWNVVGFVSVLRTIAQIFTAGIAITAFSLLLYALTFNLRDRVARSFALILGCIVIIFAAEAIGSTASSLEEVDLWYRIQWIGIIFLPPTYLHFSDALLETTGKPSRGRRKWAVRITYIVSLAFTLGLLGTTFIGPLESGLEPAPHPESTWVVNLFVGYYLGIVAFAVFNLLRAHRRTTTPTSRRRMRQLITGSLAPALGSFPYLLFGASFASRHSLLFWSAVSISNFLVGGLIVMMAFSVAFFGVSWPDRVVRTRLLKWILRGPITASITLGIVTIVRRLGSLYGADYSAFVPIVMVISILLLEYAVTLFSPFLEKLLFYVEDDPKDWHLLNNLQNRLLTRNDLQQFLETILSAACDQLQASGAYIATSNGEKLESVIWVGKEFSNEEIPSSDLSKLNTAQEGIEFFKWGDEYLLPLIVDVNNGSHEFVGILGIGGLKDDAIFDQEQKKALKNLVRRAAFALCDYRTQQHVYRSLERLTPQNDMILNMRSASLFNRESLLTDEDTPQPSSDVSQWVKDALTHYWGGPKLTTSPLMQFKVVRDALESHDGNYPNALRSVLREAIESVRPEGEQHFTGEWLLYNILDMKFIEGRKVRDIAMRLAMSEADLYRKQRIAIESVARAILEMEETVKKQEE